MVYYAFMPEFELPKELRKEFLVVDDNVQARDDLARRLVNRGHCVYTALDGLDAVQQVERGIVTPDAIIMDYSMPGLRGVPASERLRNLGASRPAVLMLSSYKLPLKTGPEHPCQDFLNKLDVVDGFIPAAEGLIYCPLPRTSGDA
jgi:CheY-like chemotaxis protein